MKIYNSNSNLSLYSIIIVSKLFLNYVLLTKAYLQNVFI